MTDRFTTEERSRIMSRIKGCNTSPERIMRRCLRETGIRFRSNVSGLPGTPDFVLTGLQAVVFVNGCFWHGHKRCRRASIPAANRAFWQRKIEGNIKRDKKTNKTLRRYGWRVFTFWQCRMRQEKALIKRLLNIKRGG